MNRIRELRVAARLTQKELADKFYVNQTAVSQWERGATSPNNATLENLAIFFDVSVGYLLGMEDYRGTTPQGRNDEKKASPPKNGEEASYDDKTRQIIDVYKRLPEELRRQALDYLAYLEERSKK